MSVTSARILLNRSAVGRCLVIGGESGAMGANALRAAPGPGH